MKYKEVESGSGTKETAHFDKETSEIYQYEGRVLDKWETRRYEGHVTEKEGLDYAYMHQFPQKAI